MPMYPICPVCYRERGRIEPAVTSRRDIQQGQVFELPDTGQTVQAPDTMTGVDMHCLVCKWSMFRPDEG